jgi:hypothetical protein
VVTVGYEAARLAVEHGDVDTFPDFGAPADLERLADAVSAGIERRDFVVAICPSWLEGNGAHSLETVRASLGGHRLAIHRSPLTPLAGTVLASLTSSLAAHVSSAGPLMAALAAVESHLLSVTWLGSVAKLRHPKPTLAQSMKARAPGTAFAVCSWPRPRLVRVRSRGGLDMPRLDESAGIAISARGSDDGWVQQTLSRSLAEPVVHEVPPTSLGPAYWGTSKVVEAVVYPVDVVSIGRWANRKARLACRWCGARVAAPPCPFCGMAAAGFKSTEEER